jgi:ketosteroid isomerase-like protein
MSLGLAALCLTVAGCNQAPVENKDSAAVTALADRVAIELLAYRYVAHLGGQSADEFGAYYTEDAVFDVNGAAYRGKAAIVGLYAGMRARRPAGQAPDANGMVHTLLTNPIIEVNGDSATGSYIWTSVRNPKDPTGVPELTEQGREYDLYAKQADGRWLIKKRTVIADGAVPKSMLDTWQRRLDYDVTKD